VKQEVEAEKRAKISSGEHPNGLFNESSPDTWEFMGVRVKPPKVVLCIATGLTQATQRVDNVIADEASVCTYIYIYV
jgi:hypothetical protein